MRKVLMVLTAVLLLMTTACARPGGAPSVGVTAPAPGTPVPPPPPRVDAPATPLPPPPAQPPAKPTESVVTIYRLSDLIAGRKEPANTWRIPDPVNGFALAPDGETALLFARDPMIPGPAPHLRHLPSGKTTPLTGPAAADWYPFGGWLPDGRLMIAGKEVWVGDGAGKQLRSIAKPGLTWIVKPSPQGDQLLLWNPGGQIEMVDLRSGQIDTLTHHFRPGAQDGAVGVAWSPDGKLLAGSDFPFYNQQSPSIRIIDAQSREQVRQIEGLALSDWLPDGNLLTWRPAGDQPISEYVMITPSGKTVREFKGDNYSPVPGGRYLLHSVYNNSQASYALIDIATGDRKPIPLPALPDSWTAAGDPILIIRNPID